jgi:hypothetical protein
MPPFAVAIATTDGIIPHSFSKCNPFFNIFLKIFSLGDFS